MNKVKFIRLNSLRECERFMRFSFLRTYRIKKFETPIRATTPPFKEPGYCYVCGKESSFRVNAPNLRETLECKKCKLNNRLRASLHFFEQEMQPTPDAEIYITEQVTRFYEVVAARYQRLIGSEYLGHQVPFGSINDRGIRNESLTRLTFPAASFDYFLSFEVFEHIPDWEQAFRECARCLKPGGKMLFTVPFVKTSPQTIIRARVKSDGEIEHLLPPEYHGDPLSQAGCLCFQHFGWDMFDALKRSGFRNASAFAYWSSEFMYLGGNQLLFAAEM